MAGSIIKTTGYEVAGRGKKKANITLITLMVCILERLLKTVIVFIQVVLL